MKVSDFLESLPDIIRQWRAEELPVASRAAEALGVTRQAYSKREQLLETSSLDSLIELIRMLESQSKNSPEIIIQSSQLFTFKGFED